MATINIDGKPIDGSQIFIDNYVQDPYIEYKDWLRQGFGAGGDLISLFVEFILSFFGGSQ